LAAVVVAVDEAADGVDEVFDAGEAAAADGLAGDDAEEGLCGWKQTLVTLPVAISSAANRVVVPWRL
jgi:hypothetical protein